MAEDRVNGDSPHYYDAETEANGNENGFDNEKQTSSYFKDPRQMARIDKPKRHGSIVAADDDSTASMSIGKQMELEAGNAIKYRTCSWRKVCSADSSIN